MKLLFVCSHGGHLTEMLQILPGFSEEEVIIVTYSSTRNDQILSIARSYFIENIGKNLFKMIISIFLALNIIFREKPDAVISLGAEIAIPFFLLAKLFGIKTIFIESWCRVENLSLTGKIVYYFSDKFLVQWPQLLKVCGSKAEYAGSIL